MVNVVPCAMLSVIELFLKRSARLLFAATKTVTGTQGTEVTALGKIVDVWCGVPLRIKAVQHLEFGN
tara:strand:+ start:445 stop:645 length:201 start_codon:yes stop_codon:yes gene_type:complete